MIVAGLPMGWAWAPIIAQFTAESVAKKIVEVCPELLAEGAVILVYIDNFIIALPNSLSSKMTFIKAQVETACRALGAVIKESAWQLGSRVEWLGVQVDAKKKMFRLKPSFLKKFDDLTRWLEKNETNITCRLAYATASCIIYAAWTRNGELSKVGEIIEWMVVISKQLQSPGESWDSLTHVQESLLECLKEKKGEVLENAWTLIGKHHTGRYWVLGRLRHGLGLGVAFTEYDVSHGFTQKSRDQQHHL